MRNYCFKALLQKDGWLSPAYVSTDDVGLITYIGSIPQQSIKYNNVDGYAIPGFQNAHSHAFQYAMAGIAEVHQPGAVADDFWSWREAMYKVALTISPDQLESIAAMLYAEMVRHGYTHVAEFHYLHHDKNGRPYANLAEHGERLVAAAHTAGIKITLIPMFYQKGGFGMEPQKHQRRFISPTIDAYNKLLEATNSVVSASSHANYGFGIHSLRAVAPEDIISSLAEIDPSLPVHIHISEQLKEVEDALDYLGKRPVQWLLDSVAVNEQYHLVHATHLGKREIEGITQSGAHVVLCPSTEGNLGDGIFPLTTFQELGGKWSIGTDSHVGLNPLEELRILDYGQRLTTHHRNIFTNAKQGDSASYAIEQSLVSGRAAMSNPVTGYFEKGQPLDAVVYDAGSPLIATSNLKNVLPTIVYSSDSGHCMGTICNGKWIVKNNRHFKAESIVASFDRAIKAIAIR
ncbi:MAG: formimidoylglutamate deiminase [Roseivirga sp.]|nr:formimidoylglutamate deiminase [Roseivirga sp.]